MTYFKNKTVIMSGGSRGVGLEIAKALGKDGANTVSYTHLRAHET